jgi:hypothetical protein
MIINNLNLKCVPVAPNETDAILIVDANTVLPLPIPLQSLKVISRKNCEITQHMGGMQLHEFSLRNSGNLLKPTRAFAFEYCLGVLSTEGTNHSPTL